MIARFLRALRRLGPLPMVHAAVSRTKNRLYTLFYPALVGARVGRGTIIEWGARLETAGGRIEIGRNCRIHRGACLLAHGGAITLGDDCSVNPYTILYGHGGLTIGAGTLIAASVVIIPANHRFALDRPIRGQGLTTEGIAIGRDVWIGTGARILDGSVVEDGAVIAAGCVVAGTLVTRASIVGGVPARIISQRRVEMGET